MPFLNGDDIAESRLQKLGNSLEIRISSNMLKTWNLNINDEVKLVFEDDKIVISKSKNDKISLEERFKEYNGDNLVKEFSWDIPRCREYGKYISK